MSDTNDDNTYERALEYLDQYEDPANLPDEAFRVFAQLAPRKRDRIRERLAERGLLKKTFDEELQRLRSNGQPQESPEESEASVDPAQAEYAIEDGRFVLCDGEQSQPVSNFVAWIEREVVRDDSRDTHREFVLRGQMASGEDKDEIRVDASDFSGMNWLMPKWGVEPEWALIPRGKRHLSLAIRRLSGEYSTLHIFEHFGWRQLDGRWHFLHGNGAITAGGTPENIQVDPPQKLGRYGLVNPEDSDVPFNVSVSSFLKLLALGPDPVMVPLLAGAFRSLLSEVRSVPFSLFVVGETGSFKSTVSAAVLSLFGEGFKDETTLPESWKSTPQSLAQRMYFAKDHPLVIDEFTPENARVSKSKFLRKAETILRAQADNQSRGRMNRKSFEPRGMVISTGENLPEGDSLLARTFFVEIKSGDIRESALDDIQDRSRAGHFSSLTAHFVRWLAPRMDELTEGIETRFRTLRDRAGQLSSEFHSRTPGQIAELYLGWSTFLEFLEEEGDLESDHLQRLRDRGWKALAQSGLRQVEYQNHATPGRQVLALLQKALQRGRAHLKHRHEDNPPDPPTAWGWRRPSQSNGETSWKPIGECIGWVDDEDVYLVPELGHKAIRDVALNPEGTVPDTAQKVGSQMKEDGLLSSHKESRNIVQRSVPGEQHKPVWHLDASDLEGPSS